MRRQARPTKPEFPCQTMKYDQLRAACPAIEGILAEVSNLCHGPAGPALAVGWAEREIAQKVETEYRPHVRAKVYQFVRAISSENREEAAK